MTENLMNELRSALTAIGAKVEQDPGGRFEVYQCVAPYGYVWKSGGKHIRIEWMPGFPTSGVYREQVIHEALEVVKLGIRSMTQLEKYECDEE